MMRRLISCLCLLLAVRLTAGAGTGKGPLFRHAACRPSERSLLSTARTAALSLRKGQALRKQEDPSAADFRQDTLKVLGLMVQFRQDADIETTGDGRFMLGPAAGVTVDPPPHNGFYFQQQLRALSNYWGAVSGGRLILEYEVAQDAFAVADSLGAYIPPESSRTDADVTAGVARFFRDAVRQADAAGVRFSDYDCLIVFHAGVGGDLAFDYDPTPRDMPSMFLNLDDLKANLPAAEFNDMGLSVQNGAFGVTEGILLPETQSQEGYEIGLLGTAALMFGFQLGLPALWDTETGRSGIGAWGLMDQGSGNYNGLIPARPSAIERMLLGWAHPHPAATGENVSTCHGYGNDDRPGEGAYEAPLQVSIAGNEYYLIENRQHDPDGDGVAAGLDANGGTVTFGADYQVHYSGEPSVIVSVDEYDFGLPGSGLLIWHVDESVLVTGMENNTVNVNPSRRGVDLEEADGSQDIGESYGMFDAGYGSETGVLQDAWYAGNDVHLLVNGSDSVAFTPSTHPNTRTQDGADSHISFFGFSESGPVMTFSLRNDRMHTDFPRFFGVTQEPFPPMTCDLNGDGVRDVILVTKTGGMYGWDEAGYFESWLQGIPIPVRPPWVPLLNLMQPLSGSIDPINVPPVCGDLNGDGADEIVLLTESGRIQVWIHDETEQPEKPRLRLDVPMEGEKGTTLLVTESSAGRFRPLIGTESGRILAFDMEGSISGVADPFDRPIAGLALWGSADTLLALASDGAYVLLKMDGSILFSGTTGDSIRSGPVTGKFATGSGIQAVWSAVSGFRLLDASGTVTEWDRPDSDGSFSSPALADINSDGILDIVSVSGGRIWCLNLNGTLIEGFPVRIAEAEAECSSPVIGDVDGDGRLDIIVSTSEGLITAVSSDGGSVEGFPLPLYGRKAVPPTLADLDEDGRIEILAASDGGQMAVWDMDGPSAALSQAWPMARHDAAGSNRSGFTPGPPGPKPSGGLMPGRTAYNYPNPAYGDFTVIRYRLREAARVRISVYSLAGAEIAAFDGPGNSAGDNEAVWSLKGVDSGVYTCRIRATASGESVSAIFKIAVVK
jgi:M6 family metalloprotease-like protein